MISVHLLFQQILTSQLQKYDKKMALNIAGTPLKAVLINNLLLGLTALTPVEKNPAIPPY